MAVTDVELARAEERMRMLREAGYAVRARYDRRTARLVVALSTGIEVAVPAKLIEGLAEAPAESLAEIEISPSGLGLHWPKLDADIYVPALLQGIFGSRNRTARELGAKAERAGTEAKSAAVRVGGRKGGRPRKIAVR